MKHLILITFLTLFCFQGLKAQEKTDSLLKHQMHVDSIKVHMLTRISQHTAPRFKLYPTDNMWTFLELDTATGRIWQVQFSTKGSDYRFDTVLNSESLILDGEERIAGRFELYKTQNMYNFILLDTLKGGTWQVQWSTESANRMIIPIY